MLMMLMLILTLTDHDDDNDNHQGDAVSMWMMQLVAEEKAARKKEKISNFDLKSIIGMYLYKLYGVIHNPY